MTVNHHGPLGGLLQGTMRAKPAPEPITFRVHFEGGETRDVFAVDATGAREAVAHLTGPHPFGLGNVRKIKVLKGDPR